MRWPGRLDRSEQQLLAGGAALFLTGLAIIVLTVVSLVREGAEMDRLRADGVPASATVTDSSSGNRSSTVNTFDLAYQYNGEMYMSTVHCPSFSLCDVATDETIPIYVDPRRPAHFTTEFGTDGSSSWFTSIGMLVPGFALALLGGSALYAVLTRDRQRR